MSRPVGLPKTGGRKIGTQNKNSLGIRDLMAEFAYDPIRSLLQKYNSLTTSEKIKIDLKLVEYIYPKPKELFIDVEQECSKCVNAEEYFSGMSEEDIKKTIAELMSINE